MNLLCGRTLVEIVEKLLTILLLHEITEFLQEQS